MSEFPLNSHICKWTDSEVCDQFAVFPLHWNCIIFAVSHTYEADPEEFDPKATVCTWVLARYSGIDALLAQGRQLHSGHRALCARVTANKKCLQKSCVE